MGLGLQLRLRLLLSDLSLVIPGQCRGLNSGTEEMYCLGICL